jgi:[acyl-carrier-protein] S-malonyltransferase
VKVAFLFPGQGAQAVGMGKALIEASAAARDVFDSADRALGEPFSRVILEGPDDELKRTKNTQPAILTMSIAALAALRERGVRAPDVVAGHSLGEYSALVAAKALGFDDAVRAVRARGTFMQEAVPEGHGAMAAVLGLDEAAITEALTALAVKGSETYCAVANLNGPGQTVIAGTKAGVDAAQTLLKEKGAKRVMPLPVSAPFHCALMSPVEPRLREVLDGIAFSSMNMPLVANVTAEPYQDSARTKQLLVEQVTAPVRFTEMAERMLKDGVTHFVEVGPGKTLIGIVKRMDKERTYLNVEDPASLDATVAALTA